MPGSEAPPSPLSWDLTRPGALAGLRARFEAIEPGLHAFLPEDERWERLAAELASLPDGGGEKSPLSLAGVPVGVKDIFRVTGMPTRAGTRLPPATFVGEEAQAVARLRHAGTVVLGKTVTTELAYFEPGPTVNPWDPGRTPGGSSSGSAAAVAAGLCPIALGTQTIGSICRPAAFCGIVGFKPSRERIPPQGVVPLAPSLDHVGVLAADVAWATRAAAVLLDDWRDLEDSAPAPPALAAAGGPLDQHLEQPARLAFAAAADRVAESFSLRTVPVFSEFADLVERHRLLMAAEAAAAHRTLYERHRHLLGARTLELIERGLEAAPAEVAAAREGRERLRQELEGLMDRLGIDLWLSPAAPGPAPRGLRSTGDPILNLPWTYAGLPTLALPAGQVDGMPVGVQLTARFGADEMLLAWAAELVPVLSPAAAEGTAGAEQSGAAPGSDAPSKRAVLRRRRRV